MPRAGVPCLVIDESCDPALVWPSTPTPTGCAQLKHGLFCSGSAYAATGPISAGGLCPVQAPRLAPLNCQRIGGVAPEPAHFPVAEDRNGTCHSDGHIRLLGRELLGQVASEKQVMVGDRPPPLAPAPVVTPAPAVAPAVCSGDPSMATVPLSLVSLMPVAMPVQAPPVGLGGAVLPFGLTGPAVAAHSMDAGAILAHATAQGPAAQQLRLLRLDGVAEPHGQQQTVPLASVDVVSLEVRQPQASRGAILHGTGQCRPCAWYWRPQGCSNGQDCCHCHMCPAGEVKARRKARMEALRASGEQSGRNGNGRSRRSHNLRISALI